MADGLTNTRVIITAGGAGIGRATARAFHAAGARVHICDVDAATLADAQAELPGLGVSEADVSDPDQVDRLFDAALDALGGLDVLVNNAGIAGPTALLEDCEPAEWRRTLAVNLDGQFYCLRRAIPALKAAGGGAIVNLASTAGLYGYPRRGPYVASKWAVVGLTKSLAIELGPSGIRVNAICPGSIEGPRMDRVIAAEAAATGSSEEEVRQAYMRNTSMRCFIDAEDIANMAVFLCSPAGAKVSGQALAVDGHTESLAN
ncbi:MAG: SDR family oxidoreductase [Kiloniellales bacterium]|jgi:NAD(P)-dependent dehydrogenase (short-subunit alcohol dehydrogenase family)